MLKKILLAVLVLVAAFFAFVATRPDTFHIERTAVVHAPSDVVYARVDDFRRWRDWSPWERLDPAMQRTFAGADKGKGAVYTWKGNDKVGSGRMTITDTEPAKEVEIRLDFLEPFASTSQAALKLAPANEGTTVTWTMDGKHNLMSKTMCLFMDMDKMVGGDFEKGLAALDSVAAADARVAAIPDTTGGTQ